MLPTWGSEPRLSFGGLVATLMLALSSFANAYDLNPNSTRSSQLFPGFDEDAC